MQNVRTEHPSGINPSESSRVWSSVLVLWQHSGNSRSVTFWEEVKFTLVKGQFHVWSSDCKCHLLQRLNYFAARDQCSGLITDHAEYLLVMTWTRETLSVPAGSSACGEGDEEMFSFIRDLAWDMMDL